MLLDFYSIFESRDEYLTKHTHLFIVLVLTALQKKNDTKTSL